MGEYFSGWQRKLGVLTLCLPLILIAGWVRSYRIRDALNYRIGDTRIHLIGSNCGSLSWHGLLESKPFQITFHNSYQADAADTNANHAVFENGKVEWHWQFGEFEFGEAIVRTPKSTMTVTIWQLPYWVIVLPLILLSAVLLLSTNRKTTLKKTAKPNSEKGTRIMGEFKPQIPAIYGRMERGEIPRWLGLSLIIVSWVFLIIPMLYVTSPIWGAAVVFERLMNHRSKRPVITDDPPTL